MSGFTITTHPEIKKQDSSDTKLGVPTSTDLIDVINSEIRDKCLIYYDNTVKLIMFQTKTSPFINEDDRIIVYSYGSSKVAKTSNYHSGDVSIVVKHYTDEGVFSFMRHYHPHGRLVFLKSNSFYNVVSSNDTYYVTTGDGRHIYKLKPDEDYEDDGFTFSVCKHNKTVRVVQNDLDDWSATITSCGTICIMPGLMAYNDEVTITDNWMY